MLRVQDLLKIFRPRVIPEIGIMLADEIDQLLILTPGEDTEEYQIAHTASIQWVYAEFDHYGQQLNAWYKWNLQIRKWREEDWERNGERYATVKERVEQGLLKIQKAVVLDFD